MTPETKSFIQAEEDRREKKEQDTPKDNTRFHSALLIGCGATLLAYWYGKRHGRGGPDIL